jgi:ribosomal-protein-alanine N-acetyltransferase
MDSGWRIRAMRWWDIDQVAALESVLFEQSRWSVEQFWSELAQPTRTYVVVQASPEQQGSIIAYAGIFVLGAESDVQTIAVAPTAQGRGIGRALMDHLMAAAREQGATQMLLEVRSDNGPAIAMYQALNFEQISIRRDYYAPGIDARIMRRRPL